MSNGQHFPDGVNETEVNIAYDDGTIITRHVDADFATTRKSIIDMMSNGKTVIFDAKGECLIVNPAHIRSIRVYVLYFG